MALKAGFPYVQKAVNLLKISILSVILLVALNNCIVCSALPTIERGMNTSAAQNNISNPRRSGDSDYDFVSSVPLEDEWSCGADEFSLYVAEATVERDCPANKNQINKCCIAHDKCYDDQLGQKHCDDVFCECLLIASEKSDICTKETGPAFCNLVREFGAEPYANSAPKQRIPGNRTL